MIQIILLAILVGGYFFIIKSKVEGKCSSLLEKTITAVLSALLLSLFLAFWEHTPVKEQLDGIGYSSLEGIFVIYLLYSLPVYVIVGTLYYFFLDVYFANINSRNTFSKYIINFFLYVVGGLLVVGILEAILLITEGSVNKIFIFNLFVFGVFASLLFYHITLLLSFLKKHLNHFHKKLRILYHKS